MVGRVVMECLIVVASAAGVAAGQMEADLDWLAQHNAVQLTPAITSLATGLDGMNEPELVIVAGIRFYQRFVSTQDEPVCNFVPSCSRYGLTVLREYGLVRGMLMASDRLQRCHGLGGGYYLKDPGTGKWRDDPKDGGAWSP